MRKGQVKLLEKAEKYGFSERKKNYLSEADKPLSFLNNIFWFLYFHSDDEMGDYSILEEINLFLIELREKECLNCSFSYKQVPVDDIRKIFHSRFSVYEKFHMLCHMDHGYSYLYSKTGKRYTIEFKHSKGNYWINQIQGTCNRGCPTEVWNYVKSFLVS